MKTVDIDAIARTVIGRFAVNGTGKATGTTFTLLDDYNGYFGVEQDKLILLPAGVGRITEETIYSITVRGADANGLFLDTEIQFVSTGTEYIQITTADFSPEYTGVWAGANWNGNTHSIADEGSYTKQQLATELAAKLNSWEDFEHLVAGEELYEYGVWTTSVNADSLTIFREYVAQDGYVPFVPGGESAVDILGDDFVSVEFSEDLAIKLGFSAVALIDGTVVLEEGAPELSLTDEGVSLEPANVMNNHSATTLSNSSIAAGVDIGTMVGELQNSAGFTFEVITDPSGYFTVKDEQLVILAIPSAGTYTIVIRSTSNVGVYFDKQFSIEITGALGISGINLSETTFHAGTSGGEAIGQFSTTGGIGPFVYTLEANPDAGPFSIIGDELVRGGIYAGGPASWDIIVRSTDSTTAYIEQGFTIEFVEIPCTTDGDCPPGMVCFFGVCVVPGIG